MKSKINYSSPEYQLEKLKNNHLIIEDETGAIIALKLYGYSNLIKSYRDPYVVQKGDHKEYVSSVSFGQILSLFYLDKSLRNNVMAAMQDLEEFIKEIIADVLAKSFGTDPENYLKFSNFRDRKTSNTRFSLKSVLRKAKKGLSSDKEPIKHYREKYGCIPPWILFKSVYFSTAVNIVKFMKPAQQSEIAERIYPNLPITTNQKRKLLNDTLAICLEYRNLCAHGGRVYNYQPQTKLRGAEIFGENYHEMTGFSQLLDVLNLMIYPEPFQRLKDTLNNELNRHCQRYPMDVTYLSHILNVNIEIKNVVYITENSEKYHVNPHCSGIKNAIPIELEDAVKNNYIPCKKCSGYKENTSSL